MIAQAFGPSGLVARLLFAAAAALVASCSGSVSAPPAEPPPAGPIVVQPAEATLYSELPTTFVITGGTGTYLITSSNQAVLPVAGTLNSNALTLVPNPVGTDTPVTLTIRDTGTATPVTASLLVKPRTISNVVTVTPSASQSPACGTAVCAGGDAEVRVMLSQQGVPLVGRQVRFDVVSGDLRIITSGPGMGEVLDTTSIATTDNTGTARIRVRVLSSATSQTALLQVTDLVSGFTQRTSVAIAPSSNAPLNAQPDSIVFVGRDPNTCASGISADVIVFGGRPPYLISQPGSFTVSPTTVTSSGGRFTVGATGQCSQGSQIAVVDANGATVSVTASNELSSVPAPTPPQQTAFSVSPSQVTLNSCQDIASVVLVGGTGEYLATSGNNAVDARIAGDGRTGRIQRVPSSPGSTVGSPVIVAFSDGQSTREVEVILAEGEARGDCR